MWEEIVKCCSLFHIVVAIEIFYKYDLQSIITIEWRMGSALVTQYWAPFFLLIHLLTYSLTHSRFMPLRSNQEKKFVLSFIVMASKHDNNDWTRFSRKFYTDADLIWLLLLFFGVVLAPSSSTLVTTHEFLFPYLFACSLSETASCREMSGR